MKKVLSVTLIISMLFCMCMTFTGCTEDLQEARIKRLAIKEVEERLSKGLKESLKENDVDFDFNIESEVTNINYMQGIGPGGNYIVKVTTTISEPTYGYEETIKATCQIIVLLGVFTQIISVDFY